MNLHTIPSLVAQSGSGVPWIPGAAGTRPAWPPYVAPAGTRMAAPCVACSGSLPWVDGVSGAGCRAPGRRSPLGSWLSFTSRGRARSSILLRAPPRGVLPSCCCANRVPSLRRRDAGGNCSWGRGCVTGNTCF